jgi:hypothetical protein
MKRRYGRAVGRKDMAASLRNKKSLSKKKMKENMSPARQENRNISNPCVFSQTACQQQKYIR